MEMGTEDFGGGAGFGLRGHILEHHERPRRVAAGLFISAILGVVLMQWAVGRRFGAQTAGRVERHSVITIRAVEQLLALSLNPSSPFLIVVQSNQVRLRTWA